MLTFRNQQAGAEVGSICQNKSENETKEIDMPTLQLYRSRQEFKIQILEVEHTSAEVKNATVTLSERLTQMYWHHQQRDFKIE